jgi:hypothetical protein
MEVQREEKSHVAAKVPKVLPCINNWSDELLSVTLKSFTPKLDEYLPGLVEHKTVLWSVDM